jgi:ferrous iron transport protein A
MRINLINGARSAPQRPGRVAHERNAMSVPLRLDKAPHQTDLRVTHVTEPPAGRDLPQRLEELGFLPGERVMVMARGVPGSDPLAIRVGHSTFALRRSEAACVQVIRVEAAP